MALSQTQSIQLNFNSALTNTLGGQTANYPFNQTFGYSPVNGTGTGQSNFFSPIINTATTAKSATINELDVTDFTLASFPSPFGLVTFTKVRFLAIRNNGTVNLNWVYASTSFKPRGEANGTISLLPGEIFVWGGGNASIDISTNVGISFRAASTTCDYVLYVGGLI